MAKMERKEEISCRFNFPSRWLDTFLFIRVRLFFKNMKFLYNIKSCKLTTTFRRSLLSLEHQIESFLLFSWALGLAVVIVTHTGGAWEEKISAKGETRVSSSIRQMFLESEYSKEKNLDRQKRAALYFKGISCKSFNSSTTHALLMHWVEFVLQF